MVATRRYCTVPMNLASPLLFLWRMSHVETGCPIIHTARECDRPSSGLSPHQGSMIGHLVVFPTAKEYDRASSGPLPQKGSMIGHPAVYPHRKGV